MSELPHKTPSLNPKSSDIQSLLNNLPVGILVLQKSITPLNTLSIKYKNNIASSLLNISKSLRINSNPQKLISILKSIEEYDLISQDVTHKSLYDYINSITKDGQIQKTFTYSENRHKLLYIKIRFNKSFIYLTIDNYNEERKNIQNTYIQSIGYNYLITLYHEINNPLNSLITPIEEIINNNSCYDKEVNNLGTKGSISRLKKSIMLLKLFLKNFIFYFKVKNVNKKVINLNKSTVSLENLFDNKSKKFRQLFSYKKIKYEENLINLHKKNINTNYEYFKNLINYIYIYFYYKCTSGDQLNVYSKILKNNEIIITFEKIKKLKGDIDCTTSSEGENKKNNDDKHGIQTIKITEEIIKIIKDYLNINCELSINDDSKNKKISIIIPYTEDQEFADDSELIEFSPGPFYQKISSLIQNNHANVVKTLQMIHEENNIDVPSNKVEDAYKKYNVEKNIKVDKFISSDRLLKFCQDGKKKLSNTNVNNFYRSNSLNQISKTKFQHQKIGNKILKKNTLNSRNSHNSKNGYISDNELNEEKESIHSKEYMEKNDIKNSNKIIIEVNNKSNNLNYIFNLNNKKGNNIINVNNEEVKKIESNKNNQNLNIRNSIFANRYSNERYSKSYSKMPDKSITRHSICCSGQILFNSKDIKKIIKQFQEDKDFPNQSDSLETNKNTTYNFPLIKSKRLFKNEKKSTVNHSIYRCIDSIKKREKYQQKNNTFNDEFNTNEDNLSKLNIINDNINMNISSSNSNSNSSPKSKVSPKNCNQFTNKTSKFCPFKQLSGNQKDQEIIKKPSFKYVKMNSIKSTPSNKSKKSNNSTNQNKLKRSKTNYCDDNIIKSLINPEQSSLSSSSNKDENIYIKEDQDEIENGNDSLDEHCVNSSQNINNDSINIPSNRMEISKSKYGLVRPSYLPKLISCNAINNLIDNNLLLNNPKSVHKNMSMNFKKMSMKEFSQGMVEGMLSNMVPDINNNSNCNCRDILLVDDEQLNNDIISDMLKNYSIKADMCNDGRECLKKINEKLDKNCQHCNKNYYKIIFMDIIMPNLNGKETVEKIQSMINEKMLPSDEINIIFVSACKYEQENFEDFKIRNPCAKEFLLKPIKKKLINEVLTKYYFKNSP